MIPNVAFDRKVLTCRIGCGQCGCGPAFCEPGRSSPLIARIYCPEPSRRYHSRYRWTNEQLFFKYISWCKEVYQHISLCCTLFIFSCCSPLKCPCLQSWFQVRNLNLANKMFFRWTTPMRRSVEVYRIIVIFCEQSQQYNGQKTANFFRLSQSFPSLSRCQITWPNQWTTT